MMSESSVEDIASELKKEQPQANDTFNEVDVSIKM